MGTGMGNGHEIPGQGLQALKTILAVESEPGADLSCRQWQDNVY